MSRTIMKTWTIPLCVLAMTCGLAGATLIDLNDFYADPTVTVSSDGTLAQFLEDPPFTPVILSNDPFFGEPEVIIPALGPLLMFEYEFTEGAGDVDKFEAWVIDPATGVSIGAPFEFSADSTSSGTVEFDLTSLMGTTGLGFQFQLSSLPGDGASTSTLDVSNLRLVPEPGAFALLGGVLLGLVAKRRMRGRR